MASSPIFYGGDYAEPFANAAMHNCNFNVSFFTMPPIERASMPAHGGSMSMQRRRSKAYREVDPVAFEMEELSWAEDLRRDLSDSGARQYLYLQAGDCEVELDWGVTILKPGAIVEAPAGSLFKLHLRGAGVAVLLKASDSFLWSLIPVLKPPASHAWRHYHRPRVFEYFTGEEMSDSRREVFAEILAARRRLGRDADIIIAGYVFVILFQPIFYAGDDVPNSVISNMPAAADRDLALEFRGLVEINFRNHVAIPAYCEELGISYAALANATRRLLSMRPLQYINSRLLLEAQRELLHTDRHVETISYELGFSSPNYFTRYFTRHAGCSPLAYRNAANQQFAQPDGQPGARAD